MTTQSAPDAHQVSFQLGESEVSLESGHMARQADGAVVLRHGNTMLLAAVTRAGGAASDRGFVPLTVDYRERSSAAGRIPGGYLRREGRASDLEVLTSRFIDRAIRPLLPKRSDELMVQITVYGAEPDSDLTVLATLAAGAAIHASSVPFAGPIVASRVIERKGEPVAMAPVKHRQNSPFDVLTVVSREGLVTLECGAREVPAATLIAAVQFAHEGAADALAAMDTLRELAGKPKVEATVSEDTLPAAGDMVRATLRARVCAGERADGRSLDAVRPLHATVGVLPTNHGSALFSRGETQALVSATLATPDNARDFETLFGKKSHRFMLHYNFPGFAVGEVKGNRGPGRREIGHGTLARKALLPVFPKKGDLHHTVRVVSDILGSDGSSSMATVCGASLALMDAGLGLQRAVAGVAMGLVAEDGAFHVLTDLSGAEDAHGDMDFKVAASAEGITAVQADTKLPALPLSLLPVIFERAGAAITHILATMDEVLGAARTSLPDGAPQTVVMTVSKQHVGRVIGSGGKTINELSKRTRCKIDIQESGKVRIFAKRAEDLVAAQEAIAALTEDLEKGKVYAAEVVSIKDYGAFVKIGSHEGLVHISELAEGHVDKVSDVVTAGQTVQVRVMGADNRGRLTLSVKAAS